MTVARPMSCIAIEVGMPPLDLSSFSSLENDLHSGPVSSIFSLTTNPHAAADKLSSRVVHDHWAFPASGHLSSARCNFISLEKSLSDDKHYTGRA